MVEPCHEICRFCVTGWAAFTGVQGARKINRKNSKEFQKEGKGVEKIHFGGKWAGNFLGKIGPDFVGRFGLGGYFPGGAEGIYPDR